MRRPSVPTSPIGAVALRFEGESDREFRARAERAALVARVLIEACLQNTCMQSYIEDASLPQFTVESVRRHPTVRVEFAQAIAFGGIGECLSATAGKHWGDGPHVLPLEKDDWFYPDRITYLFKRNSLYNRRYQQRRRMKQLLGPHRALVGEAKASTKADFLRFLTREHARLIQRVFQVSPGVFWRAAKGRRFLHLPAEYVQGELDFGE